MSAPVRIMCVECLRSAEVEQGAGGTRPSVCAYCGASLGSGAWVESEETADFETPISLALTPEEQRAWWGEPAGASAAVPETIGRFQLRELLGGGGFGQVYRAYDPRLEREVALKVLREASPTARVMERFFREARAAAQLDHPSIVSLHDAGRDSGRCWIAYQYVTGPTLSRYRDAEPLAPRAAAELALALAEALAHAHGRGVFHRDVKPANVILDGSGRPRLTDFGLARRSDHDPLMTRDGTVLGTPAYMSPEQAAGRSHEADARSDLYSLGVVLYELLCGRRPADVPSGVPAWRVATKRPPVSPRSWSRAVPRPLERICLRALAPEPSSRYPDAESLARDLRRWLARPAGRWRWPAALAAGVVAGAVVGRVGMTERVEGGTSHVESVGGVARGSSTDVGARFVGEDGSARYHRAGCLGLGRSDPEPRLAWDSRDEAEEAGRRACRLCLGGEAAR